LETSAPTNDPRRVEQKPDGRGGRALRGLEPPAALGLALGQVELIEGRSTVGLNLEQRLLEQGLPVELREEMRPLAALSHQVVANELTGDRETTADLRDRQASKG
tara:strand:+ start:4441 stop:4755 length:315 start_codon:yes stop_codon:yes gene_type:complete